jgi:hypothetical protein
MDPDANLELQRRIKDYARKVGGKVHPGKARA